jgi:hypothetical protein
VKLPLWRPFCLLTHCIDLVMVKTPAGECWVHREAAHIMAIERGYTISPRLPPCHCLRCVKKRSRAG